MELCQDYLDRTDCVAYFNDVMGDIARVIHDSVDGLPDEWVNKSDIIWSQDANDHSNCKRQVVAEVFCALRTGGHLMFTDIMARVLTSVFGTVSLSMHIFNL